MKRDKVLGILSVRTTSRVVQRCSGINILSENFAKSYKIFVDTKQNMYCNLNLHDSWGRGIRVCAEDTAV